MDLVNNTSVGFGIVLVLAIIILAFLYAYGKIRQQIFVVFSIICGILLLGLCYHEYTFGKVDIGTEE